MTPSTPHDAAAAATGSTGGWRRIAVLVAIWTMTTSSLSWAFCQVLYAVLHLEFGPGLPGFVARWAPFLVPLVIAPVTTAPRVVLQLRLRAANAALHEANGALRQEIRLREQLQAELAHQATHDPLTGLLNRRGFFERANGALVGGGILLLIDLDRFKQVNDRYGHAAGDAVLITVAAAIAHEARAAGTDHGPALVARLGGDEFVALLPAGAVAVADAIRHRLAELPVALADGRTITASGSVGVTPVSEQDSIDQALADGDSRMYRQKARAASAPPPA